MRLNRNHIIKPQAKNPSPAGGGRCPTGRMGANLISARIFIFTLIFWMLTNNLYASTLTAHAEPTAVSPGEPFNLILELDENAPSGLPDFGPLNYDFYIHGTGHRASYVYNNGQSKASTRWSVTLVSKHTGTVTIPAIQVGKARSKPFSITVSRNAAPPSPSKHTSVTPNTPDRALFMKTILSDTHPFINQQILYTVKIFHASSILDAAYQPPNLGDALTIPLSNNQQYQVIENGRPYLVEEQKYAFFPQKTGTHILFPPKFQALIYDDIPRRAEAQGPSASLDVKAIPDGFTPSNWLPAKAVLFKESYDKTNIRMTEGSTLTRTVVLKATGLPAELLPELTLIKTDAFRQYPERPTLNNALEGDNVIGTATLKINYLFNQPGDVSIPKQHISWFNTITKQKETITLPEKKLRIIADINHISAQPIKPEASQTTPELRTLDKALDKPNHIILFARLIILSALALLGLLVLFYKRKARQSIQNKSTQTQLLKTIKAACLANQPEAAHKALLAWAQHAWPDHNILNLNDIIKNARHIALTEALNKLSKALYQPQNTTLWQADMLWTAIQSVSKQRNNRHRKKSNPTQLPPLNPKSE
jgi:hypothetical protein